LRNKQKMAVVNVLMCLFGLVSNLIFVLTVASQNIKKICFFSLLAVQSFINIPTCLMFCISNNWLWCFFVIAAMLDIIISLERYHIVFFPFKKKKTNQVYLSYCALVMILSIFVTLFFTPNNMFYDMMICFSIVCSLVIYVFIVLKLYRISKTQLKKSIIHFIQMIFIVATKGVVILFDEKISELLIGVNVVLVPFLYICINKKFKQMFVLKPYVHLRSSIVRASRQ
jgi:hypothetical protein